MVGRYYLDGSGVMETGWVKQKSSGITSIQVV